MLLAILKFSLIDISVFSNMNSISMKLILAILATVLFINNQLATVADLWSSLNNELAISFSFVILEHSFKIVDSLWPLVMLAYAFMLIYWGDCTISVLFIIDKWALVNKVIKIKTTRWVMFSAIFDPTHVLFAILLIQNNLWRSLRATITIGIAFGQDIEKINDPQMIGNFYIGWLIPNPKVVSSLNIG